MNRIWGGTGAKDGGERTERGEHCTDNYFRPASRSVTLDDVAAHCVDFVRKVCRGVPFVTLDAGRPDVPTVIVDQQHGMRLATRHLLELGHRQIAHIAGPPGWSAEQT